MADDRINLRCPKCGHLRRPVLSPHLPDHVIVVCDPCWAVHTRARFARFDLGPYEPPGPRRPIVEAGG